MEPCLSSDEASCIGAELLAAAQEGREDEMLQILEEDPTLMHVTDPLGETVLHFVARGGNVNCAKQLAGLVGSRCLSEVLTEQNSEGNTPLRLALESCHEEMVQYLYDALISSRFWDEEDDEDEGCSRSYALYSDIEIQILNRALMQNDQDKDKARAITDLHLAILRKRQDLVRRILEEHPGLICHKEPRWGTALHQAASTGQLHMLRLLVQHISPDDGLANLILEGNDDQDTALHLALKKGHTEAARYLIEMAPMASYQVNKKGVSPLYLAVEKGYEDLVSYFFQVMPETAFLPPAKESLLRSNKASLAHAAIKVRNLGILRVAMEKLPELINISDYKGWKPLSYAAYKGYLDGVHYFLKNFPYSVKMYDTDGSLPIHKAVGGGHVGVVKEFVLHCPQTLHDVDRNGRSVLHLAVKCRKADALSYLTKETDIERIFDLKDRKGKTFIDLANELKC